MCLREDVLRCVAMCGDVVACAGASCVPTVASDQGRAVASLVEECEQSSSARKKIGNDVLLTDFCIILATRNPPIFRRCRIGLLDIWTFGMFRV